eukprot:s2567_g4.t1
MPEEEDDDLEEFEEADDWKNSNKASAQQGLPMTDSKDDSEAAKPQISGESSDSDGESKVAKEGESRWMIRMVLHALGHINQIARGDLAASRCENESLVPLLTRRFNFMIICLTFLTRSGQFFLLRACEAATTLQSKSSNAVNGAVRPEVQVDGWLFCRPTFQPKTKHLGPMNVLLLVALAFEFE